MRKPSFTISAAALAALLATAWATPCLLAQQPGPTPTTAPTAAPAGKLPDLWRNFVHYILLAREDAIESYGQAILNAKPDPKELYMLWVNVKGSSSALPRARGINDKIAKIVDQIMVTVNQGAKAVRTDPVEIARWINLLGGSPQQYQRGVEGLIGANEYAVPQMVNKLTDQDTPRMLQTRIETILPRLGKEAVRPLVEALSTTDAKVQGVICRALGKIGYRHAGPYLKELAEQEGVLDQTRVAALGALAAVAGRGAVKKPAAELYYDLALDYYQRRESVATDERYDTANVWFWKEGLGLSYKLVPRAIFNDIYAMRAAQKSLELDPDFYPAVTLWLAAYVRKEVNLPTGETDPTQVPGEPGADYYLLASGAKYLQAVLARAIKDRDPAIARKVIAALAQTAGAKNLVRPVEGGAPSLVAALSYPDREIRYMAAEVLAKALPQKRFPGWNVVVPVLVEALRQTGTPAAVLADPDLERRNEVKKLLRAGKLEVFDDDTFGEALEAARDAGGVDVVMLAANIEGPDPAGVVTMLRGQAALRSLPVIVLAEPEELAIARRLAKSDPLVVILTTDKLDAAGVLAAVIEADKKASGSAALSQQQSAEWAVRAADCFHLLALTRNAVYDLTQATASLIAALKDPRDEVRIAAANALAQFRSAPAQQGIADLAGEATANENVRLAGYAALAESIRMFGNELTEKQVNDVIAVVAAKGDLKLREAAARVLGLLALPSEKIKDLMLTHSVE